MCCATFLEIFSSGADFSYIFSGENFGENSPENFPPKNVGKKMEFSAEKSFEKSFFQVIQWNFPRKKQRKIGPWSPCLLFHLSGLPNDGVGRLQDLSLGRRRRFDSRKQWLESRVQVSAESSSQKGSASRLLNPVTDDKTSLRPVLLKAG
jgi:hypothetical protein